MIAETVSFNEIEKNEPYKYKRKSKIKYYHWVQEINIPRRQIGYQDQKPQLDQGRADIKPFGLDEK